MKKKTILKAWESRQVLDFDRLSKTNSVQNNILNPLMQNYSWFIKIPFDHIEYFCLVFAQ